MKKTFFAVMFLLSVSNLGTAQAIDEQGIKPYGSYHGGNIDIITLNNSKLELHIPLLSYPQRGKLQLGFEVRYQSEMWDETKSCPPIQQGCFYFWKRIDNTGQVMAPVRVPDYPGITAQLLVATGQCPDQCAYTIQTGDGSQHPLGRIGTTTYRSLDASGMLWDSSTGAITDNDGTRLSSNSGNIMEDTSGNQIITTSSSIVDSLGRNIPPPSVSTSDYTGCTGPGQISSASTWTVPWSNGASNTFKFCYTQILIFTHHFAVDDTNHTEPNGYVSMLQSIVLPDNTAWTFEYTQPDANGVNYGDLDKVTYPAGGSVSFTWDHKAGCHQWRGYLGQTASVVTSRTVDANDGTGPHTWHYVPGVGTTIVTDPLGNDVVHGFTDLTGGCSLYETQTKYYSGSSGSGTLLKTVNTDYTWNGNPYATTSPTSAINVVPIRLTTIWGNGQTRKTEYTYDSGFTFLTIYNGSVPGIYGLKTAVNEFDYGSGTPGPFLRSKQTSYLSQSPAGTQYLSYNVLNVPSGVAVYDAANNRIAQTTNSYDETVPAASGISTSHNLNPVNGNVRGNLTSINHWLNGSTVSTANCPVSVTNGYLMESKTYLDTGMVSQSTDPCHHATTFQYSSLYAGAYLTSTCDALNHCTTVDYNQNPGSVTGITDPNGQVTGKKTSYIYDDLGRLTTANYPDSGQTNFFYPDAATVEIKKLQDAVAGTWTDRYAYFDGLLRPKQTRLVDPEGDVFSETSMDSVGRVGSSTNPHRSVSAATDGTTRNAYDALGRPTDVTKQDGGVVHTDYSGNVVTVFDETSRQRRSISDALGGVLEVDEPGDTTAHPANHSAAFQTDGNFVVYDQANKSLWASNTAGSIGPLYVLTMQDNGNLIKYTPTWNTSPSTSTGPVSSPYGGSAGCIGPSLASGQNLASGACLGSPSGRFIAVMQTAGNFVVYDRSYSPWLAVWYNSTTGTSGSYLAMQGDGNLVIYTSANVATWASNTTTGTANYVLKMQDDGNLVIYKDLWETSTAQAAVPPATWSTLNCTTAGQNTSLGQSIFGGTSLTNNQCLISSNGRFGLLMQNDGNVLIYDRSHTPAQSIWTTNTTATVYDPAYVFATLYSYDALGNLIRVEQHGNSSDPSQWRVRTFSYDSLSHLTQAYNPESGQINYGYDADGNMVTKTDARGIITTLGYDSVHRLAMKTYSDGTASVNNTYDVACFGATPSNPIGRLVCSVAGNTELLFSYDPMGRVLTQWDCPPSGIARGSCYVISALYNQLGAMNNFTYPDGRNITIQYNTADRMTGITFAKYGATQVNHPYYSVPQSQLAANWGYWPSGGINRAIYGNGVVETTGSNSRLQMSSISELLGTTTLFNKSYSFYDSGGHDNGNIMGITDLLNSAKNQTYGYDSWNRILNAAQADNAFNVSYNIDPWGNVHESGTSNFNQPFDNRNRIQQPPSCSPNVAPYCYDASGNLINDGLHLYTFDAENRIITVDGSAASYTYNGRSDRVRKNVSSGSSTEYFLFQGDIIAELNPATGEYKDYIYGFGNRIAVDGSSDGSGVQYFHGDHLGTVRIMTNGAGTKVSDCTYAPFGEEVSCSPSNPSNHYKFTSKELDSESGLYDYGARFYGTPFARFITPDEPFADQDPGEPQTWNLYTYAGNNPLRFTDLDGRARWNPCAADATTQCWTGDFNGEKYCGFGNGECLYWDSTSQTWGASPPKNGGNADPQFLGPFDVFFFRVPGGSVARAGEETAAKLAAEATSKLAAEAAAKAAAEAALKKEVADLVNKAAATVGNQGVQATSRQAAEEAAKEWVGAGARSIVDRQTGQVVGQISADGSKVARFTSAAKAQPYINLVNKATGGNLHVRF